MGCDCQCYSPLPHTDGECDGAVARVTESERSGEWQTNQDIQTAQPHFKVRVYTVFIISVSSTCNIRNSDVFEMYVCVNRISSAFVRSSIIGLFVYNRCQNFEYFVYRISLIVVRFSIYCIVTVVGGNMYMRKLVN